MVGSCNTYQCGREAWQRIWQAQPNGRKGWTVLCETHAVKYAGKGDFERGADRKLVKLSWWRAVVKG